MALAASVSAVGVKISKDLEHKTMGVATALEQEAAVGGPGDRILEIGTEGIYVATCSDKEGRFGPVVLCPCGAGVAVLHGCRGGYKRRSQYRGLGAGAGCLICLRDLYRKEGRVW